MFHPPQRGSQRVPFNAAHAPSGWTRAAARLPGEPRAEPTTACDGPRGWEAGRFVLTVLPCLELPFFIFHVSPLLSSCPGTVTGLPGPFHGDAPKRKLSLERHRLLVSSFLELDNLETPSWETSTCTDVAGYDQLGGCLTMRTVQNRNGS